jgi:adenylate kinase family enzyme
MTTNMQKVAVFGNTGGGKSTLSKKLAEITGLPLYPLDKIQYRSGGIEVPLEDYQRRHQEILLTDRWIIEGWGCMETLWQRLDAADTLVYIDLPPYVHFWWVTKRLFTGSFKLPEGWPESSPIFKSSLNSYQVIWLCHKYLTPKYREYIDRVKNLKSVYHLRSPADISQFVKSIDLEPKK